MGRAARAWGGERAGAGGAAHTFQRHPPFLSKPNCQHKQVFSNKVMGKGTECFCYTC